MAMGLRDIGRGGPSALSHSTGSTSSIRRIQRELKEISDSPSRHWTAGPAADDLYEWQFVLRGPPDTDFEGGIYTGRIALPVNYPLAPPSITLLTPNGRWEVGKKICLSNSNYHPEMWQPAWGIRTMMEALRSHFPMPGDGAIGSLDWPSDMRRRLAKESLDFVSPGNKSPNRDLLPVLAPEELHEELPEPSVPVTTAASAPLLNHLMEDPAVPAAGAAPAAAAAEVPLAVPPSPSSVAAPAVPTAEEPQRPADEPSTSAASSTAAATADAAADVVTSTISAPLLIGPTPGAPSRRRQQAAQQQRRAQPLIVQLVKPPRTGREWLLLVVDLLLLLLSITFVMVFVDILRNPPKLLNPLPEQRDSKGA